MAAAGVLVDVQVQKEMVGRWTVHITQGLGFFVLYTRPSVLCNVH